MTEEKQQDKLNEALLELADLFDVMAIKLRTICGQTQKPSTEKSACTADPDKIQWIDKRNENGDFQLATKADHQGNADYAALEQYLRAQKNLGAFYRGLWYWLFKSGDAIGRKKIQKKEKP